jgi:two-component system, NarL family, invasion response regulator UvrY
MGSFIKIAIAEDHTLVRDGFITLIHQHTTHKVVADAENGADLIDKIAMLRKPPDVCILDISMPVLNGYDTLKVLKKQYPDMKFLALTMLTEGYSIIRMILNGVHGYLLKNSKIQELGNAITTVYRDGYYYSKVASEKAFSIVKYNHLPGLKEKELEFLCLCCSELSYSQIAEIMHVSIRTVEGYQDSVSMKLNIHSRNGLVLFAVHTGLAPIN